MILRKHKGELLYDPEIEKTARSNLKKTRERMADDRQRTFSREELEQEMARRVEAERTRWLAEREAEALQREQRERERSCLESITPQFKERQGVVYGNIGANQTFKIDASVLSSLRDIQFNGLKDECPIDHLRNFLDIASCYQVANVTTD